MGACVSVHKESDSSMKLRLPFGSKTNKVITPSPIKDITAVNGGPPMAGGGFKSQWSPSRNKDMPCRDLSSKEETFFDSQPWLESDCEDDFFSVNGDFTPSRGNTPVHQGFSAGNARVNSAIFDNKTADSNPGAASSGDKKKKLADLFRESLKGDQELDEESPSVNQNCMKGKTGGKTTILGLPPRPENHNHFVACDSERTSTDERPENEKPSKSLQCCLPRAFSSRSFGERKKKSSPTRSTG